MSPVDETFEVFDLTGQEWVLPSPEDQGGVYVLPDLPCLPAPRADHLVVCRESNEFDKVLMQSLIDHTMSYTATLPSSEIARRLGITPLDDPDALPRGVRLVKLSHGRARAVLFVIGNDWYLYSMTSAAKSDEKGNNDWSQIFVAVLQALRPRDVWAASMSRLVRAFVHSALVLHAVSQCVDRVHAGDTVITMRGDGAQMGQIMWSTLTMVAASERDLIVQRLTAGLVAKYRRGEWVKGKAAVPVGYRLDEANMLVKDPDQQDLLSKVFSVLSDPDAPDWLLVRRLGELGLTTPTLQKRYGIAATVADLKCPDTYIRGFMQWCPLYVTGSHTIRWANPFPGSRHIAGLEVHDASERSAGKLHFTYQMERPDVPVETVQAVMAMRRGRYQQTGAAARRRVPPLNGFGWIQGGHEFLLLGHRQDTYELRMRPVSEK